MNSIMDIAIKTNVFALDNHFFNHRNLVLILSYRATWMDGWGMTLKESGEALTAF